MDEALMVAVSLAVAAIPEGLPAVITITLAIGVRRMAERHAVVRHLPAVETLGSKTVICSDKTGTLTRNEMTVQVAWLEGHEYRFSGIGYAPDGEIEHDGVRLTEIPPKLQDLLAVAVLCNDAALRPEGAGWAITGDPTEAALLVAGQKAGLNAYEFRGRATLLAENMGVRGSGAGPMTGLCYVCGEVNAVNGAGTGGPEVKKQGG